MIQNVRNTGRRLKVRYSDRLRVHFLSLARRVSAWRQSTSFSDSGAVIGVTSVEAKAGRSVVAFNLAASLANITSGDVLYIETQFGQPQVTRKMPRPAYGLSDVLLGEKTSADCIVQTNVERLFILGCGRIKARDAVELPVESLESLASELCDSFEYVIVDLPLADEMTHCFPMVQSVDGVLIVNSSGDIQEDRIQRSVRRFRDMAKPVIGLVLNKS